MAPEGESPALTQTHFQQSVILHQLGTIIQSVQNNTITNALYSTSSMNHKYLSDKVNNSSADGINNPSADRLIIYRLIGY